jgi:tetratricopeptide (TPR) repeat protein
MKWRGSEQRQARRELVGVVLLSLASVVLFAGTRALARHESRVHREDAALWYASARAALDAGRSEAALTALRRASSLDRRNREYAIAFGEALADAGRLDRALRVLEALRNASPGDPRINLALARIAADSRSVDAAVRFYHSALYGTWPDEAAQERTDVRVELVRMLLSAGRRDAARAELAALEGTAPDTLDNHLAVGSLLLQAGDAAHALDAYGRALALDGDDDRARAGAGRAAFALGRYPEARRWLSRVTALDAELTRMREIAGYVQTANPLAPRLSTAERRRRAAAALRAARERVQTCLLEPGLATHSRTTLGESLAAAELASTGDGRDDDVMSAMEATLGQVRRLEEAADGICPADALNTALLVIARRVEEEAG